MRATQEHIIQPQPSVKQHPQSAAVKVSTKAAAPSGGNGGGGGADEKTTKSFRKYRPQSPNHKVQSVQGITSSDPIVVATSHPRSSANHSQSAKDHAQQHQQQEQQQQQQKQQDRPRELSISPNGHISPRTPSPARSSWKRSPRPQSQYNQQQQHHQQQQQPDTSKSAGTVIATNTLDTPVSAAPPVSAQTALVTTSASSTSNSLAPSVPDTGAIVRTETPTKAKKRRNRKSGVFGEKSSKPSTPEPVDGLHDKQPSSPSIKSNDKIKDQHEFNSIEDVLNHQQATGAATAQMDHQHDQAQSTSRPISRTSWTQTPPPRPRPGSRHSSTAMDRVPSRLGSTSADQDIGYHLYQNGFLKGAFSDLRLLANLRSGPYARFFKVHALVVSSSPLLADVLLRPMTPSSHMAPLQNPFIHHHQPSPPPHLHHHHIPPPPMSMPVMMPHMVSHHLPPAAPSFHAFGEQSSDQPADESVEQQQPQHSGEHSPVIMSEPLPPITMAYGSMAPMPGFLAHAPPPMPFMGSFMSPPPPPPFVPMMNGPMVNPGLGGGLGSGPVQEITLIAEDPNVTEESLFIGLGYLYSKTALSMVNIYNAPNVIAAGWMLGLDALCQDVVDLVEQSLGVENVLSVITFYEQMKQHAKNVEQATKEKRRQSGQWSQRHQDMPPEGKDLADSSSGHGSEHGDSFQTLHSHQNQQHHGSSSNTPVLVGPFPENYGVFQQQIRNACFDFLTTGLAHTLSVENEEGNDTTLNGQIAQHQSGLGSTLNQPPTCPTPNMFMHFDGGEQYPNIPVQHQHSALHQFHQVHGQQHYHRQANSPCPKDEQSKEEQEDRMSLVVNMLVSLPFDWFKSVLESPAQSLVQTDMDRYQFANKIVALRNQKRRDAQLLEKQQQQQQQRPAMSSRSGSLASEPGVTIDNTTAGAMTEDNGTKTQGSLATSTTTAGATTASARRQSRPPPLIGEESVVLEIGSESSVRIIRRSPKRESVSFQSFSIAGVAPLTPTSFA